MKTRRTITRLGLVVTYKAREMPSLPLISNQFTVAAGQTISVIATGSDGSENDLIQWSAIEVTPVETPPSVPEPGSLLGLLALGGLGANSAFKKLKN
ncbi:MAG: PEP-CTERM sorting domain-containing protein [Crocosphaera sp.]